MTNKTAEFKKDFPLGKVPAMKTASGKMLFESNAIALYVASYKRELIGATSEESAEIQMFMDFANNELNGPIAAWYYPLAGYAPFNEAVMKKGKEDLLKVLAILDKILLPRTFLVGERATLADIVVVCSLYVAMSKLLEAADREPFINVMRWYVTCVNQPAFKEVIGAVGLCTKTMEAVKPAAPVAAVAAAEEEEEEPVVQTGFNLESWKRFYSNNPTRPTALDYFWANYEPENYSCWRVSYKYPEDLKMIFMTCNLITGLYNRMDHLRKISFGMLTVFGESNNNQIEGVFVFKGAELPAELLDVPDYESYSWTRMDLSAAKDKEIFEDFLADDGKFEGITRPLNQSKCFK